MSVAKVQVDFAKILAELEADKELQETIREHQKEVDQCSRSIATVLNKIHSTPAAEVYNIIEQTLPLFANCRRAIRAIVDLVPANQYYKWNDSWTFGLQRAAYSAALTFYLATGRLIKKDQVAQILDIRSDENHKFKLSTEEYLHSLVSLVNELSRLAVNSVTLGDFGTPPRLSGFVKDLHAGFQMLNLKNDSLRKRFDSIKYDVKKIEEVVYDLSLRGLIKTGEIQAGIGQEMDEATVNSVLILMSSK